MNRGLIILLALGCGSATDALDDSPAGSVDGPWNCLGEAPEMAPREPGRVQYEVAVVDFDSHPQLPSAVPGLEVSVCLDASCSPEFRRCADVSSDACYGLSAGAAPHALVFDFPFGLQGHLRFSAPGYVPLDYALGGPMVGNPDGEMSATGRPITMISAEDNATVYRALGKQSVDPSRGVLMLSTLGCDGRPAPMVTVEPLSGDFSPPAAAFALSLGNVPILGSTETDHRGSAGFADVSPQTARVIGTTRAGDELAEVVAPVRAGAITVAEMRPGLGLWGQ